MSWIVDFFKSRHIQMALAAGASIITLAYFSKHVLPEPLGNLEKAFPPFLAVIADGIMTTRKGKWIARTWIWILAVLLATAAVIAVHWT